MKSTQPLAGQKPGRTLATAFALAATLLTVSGASAASGRVNGKVIDSAGQPILTAKVIITNPKVESFKKELSLDKRGEYSMMFVDASYVYHFRVEAEGYQPFESNVKPNLSEALKKDFTLLTMKEAVAAGAATQQGGAAAEQTKTDPVVTAFNEGIALSNAGDKDGALLKFQEVVAAKPETFQAWANMTKIAFEQKQWEKTIEYGEKALSYNSELPGVVQAVTTAYKNTGNKEKHAEYVARLKELRPPSASELFNEAAVLINKGKDKDAIPILQEAIAADPAFAESYFELGMVQFRVGQNAGAKESLQKYLEVAPSGKNAALAKEALQFIK